jgi:hypothetical protein
MQKSMANHIDIVVPVQSMERKSTHLLARVCVLVTTGFLMD